MSFLDNLSKTVGSAASTAAKKSGELVETTKMNMVINKEEECINKIYNELGKKFYEANENSEVNDEYAEIFQQIKEHKEIIDELKEKLSQIGE